MSVTFVKYKLRIGHPHADRSWMVGDSYKEFGDVEQDAEFFESKGFWISISKSVHLVSESETIIKSTWNE